MRKPSTGTPSVSSSSAVAGTSRIDLTPEETTSASVRIELAEVGRDVRRRREAAVDAAEPAGAHEADPDRAAGRERAADGRRADRVLDERGGEVARADLARVGVEALELVLGEADPEPAVEDADGRRHGAGLADAALALEPDRDALAGGKAVRDQRRLERDDGSPLGERLPDLGGHDDQILHGIDPSFATQRAAASSASSGPPTR